MAIAKKKSTKKAKAGRVQSRDTSKKQSRVETGSSGGLPASKQIDRYIAGLTDWRGKTLARIRKIFLATDPAIVEQWKWMGSPVWSHSGVIAVGNAHKDKVKLTFNQGARLVDSHKLFNAGLGGNQWRAIDLHEGESLDESNLQDLIRAAIEYNTEKRK